MYEMCRKLIEKGRTDGLAEKIGKRYLFDRLSEKAVHRVDRTAYKYGEDLMVKLAKAMQ